MPAIFISGFTTVVLLFVVVSVAYGHDVDYRFEVAAITVDWTTFIVASTLLASQYRRDAKDGAPMTVPART